MKSRILIGTIFLPALCFSQSNSQLTGYVVEQNSKKAPVANAIVKSFGANSVKSSSSGYFILTFQNLLKGKNVVVRVEKDGWELVNEKEMDTKIPDNPDEKPLKIIICKAGMLAKARSEYYNTFEQNLQKELEKQKALHHGDVKKIAQLEEDYAGLLKQLNDLADEYSRINTDDATEKELKAIGLFKAGKYDEFIKLKREIVTEEEVDKAIKNKDAAKKITANADSTIALYFKSQKDIANTFLLKLKFDSAEVVYENVFLKDTSNFENTFSFALYLQKQNKHDKAISYYKKALKLTAYDPDIAATQNNLGIIYQDKNDYAAALTAYGKALKIRERLAKDNPATYEPDFAMTQNNLGILYEAKNDHTAALAAYSKALEIYERMAKDNPATYEPDVAMTQNNLGGLYQAKNDYVATLAAYSKALEIRERLAKDNPAVYEPNVASTQNNLGLLYKDKNDYVAALTAYGKALEIRERLAKDNPATYEPGVASTLNNLGVLYKDKNDYAAALTAYGKALEIRERLAKDNPAVYEPDVASTQNNLGILYKDKNDYAAALTAYSKALEIRERLARDNPAVYEPDVAITQNNLGNLYQAKNDYTAALTAYKKALEIRERLAKDNPATYGPDAARTQNNLGTLYQDKNDYAAALTAYNTALEIYERLAEDNRATYEPDVAATQGNLGNLYQDKNDYAAALTAYGKTLEIYERLAKDNPTVYEPDVARTQNNLGALYQTKNDYVAALTVYGKALNIYERLAKDNPATYEPYVAITQNNLGILYKIKDDYVVALTAYGKALEIYERLAKDNPAAYEIELCRTIVLLGLLQKADYQVERQNGVNAYLNNARSKLAKYQDIPLAETLLQHVNDLVKHFKTMTIVLEIDNKEKQLSSAKNNADKITIQKEIVGMYRSLVSDGYPGFADNVGISLGGLAWYQLFEKQFSAAENTAIEALNPTQYAKTESYDEKLDWVNTNLALALLYQGKYAQAERIYSKFKYKPYKDQTFREVFLADLDELEQAGITHPDIAKVRALLKK